MTELLSQDMRIWANDLQRETARMQARAEAAEEEVARLRKDVEEARALFFHACGPVPVDARDESIVDAVVEWVNKRGGEETADQIAAMAVLATRRALSAPQGGSNE